MPTYSGTVARTPGEGDSAPARPCRLEFNDESLTLIPAAGPPLSLDLGDIDELSPTDYELHLTLYTGEKLVLARFGKSFQDLLRELQEAYRDRLVRCLLLEDLEEIARYEGSARLESGDGSFSAQAEIRLYQSNLAVLPQAHTGFQWRLADIETLSFDDSSYSVMLRSGGEILSLNRLAKRTQEFYDRHPGCDGRCSRPERPHGALGLPVPDTGAISARGRTHEGRACDSRRQARVDPSRDRPGTG